MARRTSGNMIRAIRKFRQDAKGHVEVPLSMEEISLNVLPEIYTVTESGDPFLVIKDNVNELDRSTCFLVFMSPIQKEILRKSRKWCWDGTFKTCPFPFTVANGRKGQVYILYAQIESGAYVPCAFALLPDKEAETYYRMFVAIYDALTNEGALTCLRKTVCLTLRPVPLPSLASSGPTQIFRAAFSTLNRLF